MSFPPAYQYYMYLLIATVAAIVSAYTIDKIMFIANKRHIYDIPDNVRKIHGDRIPSLGGIGIFTGFLLTLAFFSGSDPHLGYIIVSSSILFFTGMYDDIMNMSPVKKLLAQLTASFITVYFSGAYLMLPLGGSLALPLSVASTTVAVTFFINVFNFIDGIDGLACMLAIFYVSILGWFFAIFDLHLEAGWAFGLLGATIGLLIFNYPPARIYMGDTGSMILGFCIAILSIRLCNYRLPVGDLFAHTFIRHQGNQFILIGALLFLPVFDALRVFTIRLSRGQSPLSADRLHLHYYLIDSGFTHTQAAWLLLLTNTFTSVVAFMLQDANRLLVIPCIMAPTILVAIVASSMKKGIHNVT